jgi:hypothetical protein
MKTANTTKANIIMIEPAPCFRFIFFSFVSVTANWGYPASTANTEQLLVK